jgi:protein tyrosine phosphatase (PTP) superfamily phosphohydrolase (DUF442 family)
MNPILQKISVACGVAMAIALAGCTADTKRTETVLTEKPVPVVVGSTEHVFGCSGFFIASQPAAGDFDNFKKQGVRTVINLRHPEENTDFDEKDVVGDLDLIYHNEAWSTPAELTDEKLDRILQLMRDEPHPILLHFSSANRAAAVWFAHQVLDGSVPLGVAATEAKEMGLKSEDFERVVRAYIEKRKRGV